MRSETMIPAARSYYPQEGVSVQVLFAMVRAKPWWIITSVTLFTAIFFTVAFAMMPVYRATVVLAPASPDRGSQILGSGTALGGLAAGLGLGLGSHDSDAEEALAVLQSREFTQRFIATENLLPKLFSEKWNSVTGTWKVAEKKQPTLGKAFKYFDTKVRSVTEDRKTGLITLQIDWTDRNEAAEWANRLVHDLNEEMRARAIAKSDASMRFLEKELQTTAVMEVRDAISRLMEDQVKERMYANVTPDYSFRVVDRAIPADRDDPVKPKKALLIAAGVY